MNKPVPPDDLWVRMDKVRAECVTEEISATHPGEEWFSIQEYLERYKVSRNTAAPQLRRLVEQGRLETKMFKATVAQGEGRVARRTMRFYRVKV